MIWARLKRENSLHATCRSLGLQEKALREILTAADDNSSLSIINGMELAVLQAAGSDTLDLSGWVYFAGCDIF